MIKKSSKILALGSIVAIFGLGIAVHNNLITLPLRAIMHSSYIADFSNDKELMGATHNVFVGKVVKQISSKDLGVGPETQFSVEIVSNIKGNLSGTVLVDQFGGYKNGILYVNGSDPAQQGTGTQSASVTSGDKLLEPGKTYLFASRYNAEQNWYTLVSHPNARKLISSDKNLSISQLKLLAQKDTRVIQLQEAYKSEILFQSDVLSNNARNSYRSLPTTQKTK